MMRSLLCVAASLAIGSAVAAQISDTPWEEQAFIGLSLRQTDAGPVVSWVRPGPLGGTGFESASGVRRGDNFVALNGKAMDAEAFGAAIRAAEPGTRVTLTFRRSPESSAGGAIAQGGAGGEPYDIACELSDRATWSGTVGRGLGSRELPEASEGAFERQILDDAAAHGIAGHSAGLVALMASIGGVQAEAYDPLALPAVVHALERPLSLDAAEASLAEEVNKLAALSAQPADDDLERIAALVRTTLDLPAETDAARIEADVSAAMREADLPRLAAGLVEQMRTDWSIQTDAAADHLRVIRFAGEHAPGIVSRALARMAGGALDWERTCASGPALVLDESELPEGFCDAVTGDVFRVRTDADGRWAVHGGDGPNTYDTSRVSYVYDTGGNDRYSAGDANAGRAGAPWVDSAIVDLAGDDVYETDRALAGPASAVFGFALIDDRAGNDRYESSAASTIGAGVFGVGVVLDRAGNDTYVNRGDRAGFSLGSGFYGSGLIIDLAGDDAYLGEKLCQGVGGAGGFGAIIDLRGRDLYRANGQAFASAYGTPGVYLGMSQGFGYGIRGYASGGVGALYDLAGDDRYEAGEFSQGGGYYFGLGVLHDRGGRDVYFGNRYGQAFAAHQAAGILVDHAGDDTYWSMTAASQAGSWDQSVAMLIDHAGDDTYRCDGLGLGGAAMQSIAVAIDRAGDDAYHAAGSDTLGRSGGNGYHFDADGVLSFSYFRDGGGADRYPASRGDANGQTLADDGSDAGEMNGSTRLFGVFVDQGD